MRPKRDSSYGYLKALLLLGRVSNLPTVWSNCLAAWLLAGGVLIGAADVKRFAWLIVGATLLYLAGMFLNDAFDERFDREHRTERPIPCGAISARTVWILGSIQMVIGFGCVVWINSLSALFALCLIGGILSYNRLHKRIICSPLIMGLCRFLLYLLAGAVAVGSITLPIIFVAVALCGYVVGLSNIARREATGGRVNSWPAWLLVVPLLLAFALPYWRGDAEGAWHGLVVAAGLYALWTTRSLLFTFKSLMPQHSRTVSGLLAGIVLFDFLLARSQDMHTGLLFFGLFGLALLLQRHIPAT
jgi:4-hydroxybenzoate polyprenyltransferase